MPVVMTRWVRRTLRRYGYELPFRQVICPAQIKTIRVDASWRAVVTVRSTLVFLDLPDDGDLHDFYPFDPSNVQSVIHQSSDSVEIGRRRYRSGTLSYWRPRDPLVRYAAYDHQYTWSSPGWESQASLYTEMSCDMRTGVQTLQIAAPLSFTAAVAFKRPRWPRLTSERSLIKYALARLDRAREHAPVIFEDGQRVEVTILGPRVGDRYVCIAFTADGLAEWRERLAKTSLAGRVRGALGSLVPVRRGNAEPRTRMIT
jgi:hypothetical protein